MNSQVKTKITVETIVNVAVERAWKFWTEPEHIKNWNHASDDWHTTFAENDLKPGGKFTSRMEAKDGSSGFDFAGIYDVVSTHQRIEYTLDDGRKVEITFSGQGNETKITETFEAEDMNSLELQKNGWQAIIDNYKKYTESH